MRINKYIALCGVASRRKAEELILAGKVKVNDNIVTELSYQVDEENDVVKVDDKIIKEEKNKDKIILLASHDLDDLNLLCDEIYFIENGRIKDSLTEISND